MEKDEEYQPKPTATYKTRIIPGSLPSLPLAKDAVILSDHAAQIIPIAPGFELMIWNIMCRGQTKKGKSHANNAYNQNQTDKEYSEKLKKVTKFLETAVSHNPLVPCIQLEEAPKEPHLTPFIESLRSSLPGWTVDKKFFQEMGDFGVLTLYKNSAQLSTPKVVSIPRLSAQKGRVLAVDFVLGNNPIDSKPIRIINSHFSLTYQEDEQTKRYTSEDCYKEIETLLQSTDTQVVLAGDFNQRLSQVQKHKKKADEPGFYFYSETPSSYSYDSETKSQKLENVDGFIFSYDPNTYVYKANPTQAKVEANFYQSITFEGLERHFLKQNCTYTKIDSNTVKIEKMNNSVLLKKTGMNIEFTTNQMTPSALNILTDAIRLCLPSNTAVNINVQNGTAQQQASAQEAVWLQLIKDGFTVANYRPDETFINHHLPEIPAQYRDKILQSDQDEGHAPRR